MANSFYFFVNSNEQVKSVGTTFGFPMEIIRLEEEIY